MCALPEFIADPIGCVPITSSPAISPDIILPNACLLNSYNAARLTATDLMVEGILLTLSKGKVIDVQAHCWNRTPAGEYYNATTTQLNFAFPIQIH